MGKHRLAMTTFLLSALVGCGKQAASPPAPLLQSGAQPTYTWLAKNVFQARCVICHNDTKAHGNVSFSSYPSLLASKGEDHPAIVAGSPTTSAVYIETSGQKMPPPSAPLSSAEVQAVHDWIQNGAPATTPGVTLPGPGAPNPPQANFEWLSKNSLRRCSSCHGAPFTPAGIDFTSYATLAASTTPDGSKALVAGDPGDSLIYQVVSAGTMPPPSQTLTTDELGALQSWIQSGAPNN